MPQCVVSATLLRDLPDVPPSKSAYRSGAKQANNRREIVMTSQLKNDSFTTRSHRVRGGGGIELYVEETGNDLGRPVLFIHGIAQCRLSWRSQLRSALRQDLRLVALDLRGHGASARPRDAYSDSALWADDIQAVITALELEQPILCGWSYGGVVIGDYLRAYGESALGGIALVGAASRLGEPVMPFLGGEFIATLPGMFSNDVEACTAAVEQFVRITTYAEPTADDFYLAMGYNMAVPSHVRQEMLSRTLNHDDLLARLTLPTLIVHGLEDKIVLSTMSEHHAGLIPHAQVRFYPGIGHAPFSESAQTFNAELLNFASSL
jgi:non-heme chloroperoxidase